MLTKNFFDPNFFGQFFAKMFVKTKKILTNFFFRPNIIFRLKNILAFTSLTLSHTGGIFPSTARGGVNLTRTYLTAAEGTIRHILGNNIEGTFKGGHQ